MPGPLKIGLTGGIAAGKSEALAAFGRLGAATVSSDAIVHELLETEPLIGRIAERWPDAVEGGAVDRRRIGEIVFADPGELAWLESQVHPLVGSRIASWLGELAAEAEFAVIEVPLLFESDSGLREAFDATVAVVAAEELRRERAEARGHALVDEREARQLSQAEKAARADHVIANDGSVEDLERALAALLDSLRR